MGSVGDHNFLWNLKPLKQTQRHQPYGLVFANSPEDRVSKQSKWYLIPLCLTLSTEKYVSRVKRSNQGKDVAHSHTSV